MRHSGGPCRHSQEMQDQDFYTFKQLSTGLWVRIEGKCCSTACSGYSRKLQCCDDTLCWKKEEKVGGSEQTKDWAESRGGCGDWSISYREKLRELKLFILEKILAQSETGSFTWIWGKASLLCGWLSTRTVCPERPWSLLPCRYSQATWRQSCGTSSSWTCFSRGVGPGDFRRLLQTPTILSLQSGWFSSVFSRAPGCLSAPVGWGFVALCCLAAPASPAPAPGSL